MKPKTCFVVMPFLPELNFFFLYLRKHIEETHGLEVRRGDTSILTKALMEKIEGEIQAADVIIGDVTRANPNVFYELGIARAVRKPVIYITQDSPEGAPVDLRQFEFIRYDLAKEEDFLSKIDNALRNAMGEGYREMYDAAAKFLQEFNAETGSTYAAASFEEFQARALRGERLEERPDPGNDRAFREFLLPKIVSDATDIGTLRKIEKWLSSAGNSVQTREQSTA